MKQLIIPLMLCSMVILPAQPLDAPQVQTVAVQHYEAVETKIEPVQPMFKVNLSAELQEHLYNECMARGVDPLLALAVMLQENRGFDPALISATNDYGLFQINKINHKRMAELGYTDMLNANQNISSGVYILAECLSSSRSNHEALMAYNLGRTGANRAMAKGNYSTSYSRAVMAFYDGLKAGQGY